MSNESELLSGTVKISRAKDAEWLRPTGIAVGCSAAHSEHTDIQDRRCIGRGYPTRVINAEHGKPDVPLP